MAVDANGAGAGDEFFSENVVSYGADNILIGVALVQVNAGQTGRLNSEGLLTER